VGRVRRRGRRVGEKTVPLVAGQWREKRERHRRVDERERRNGLGQYRYTEGRKYVWLAGRVRRVALRGAVVLTREEGGQNPKKRQRVNEQLSRRSEKAVRRVRGE